MEERSFITPDEIGSKEFEVVKKTGFDKNEVKLFLEQIKEDYGKLLKERDALAALAKEDAMLRASANAVIKKNRALAEELEATKKRLFDVENDNALLAKTNSDFRVTLDEYKDNIAAAGQAVVETRAARDSARAKAQAEANAIIADARNQAAAISAKAKAEADIRIAEIKAAAELQIAEAKAEAEARVAAARAKADADIAEIEAEIQQNAARLREAKNQTSQFFNVMIPSCENNLNKLKALSVLYCYEDAPAAPAADEPVVEEMPEEIEVPVVEDIISDNTQVFKFPEDADI